MRYVITGDLARASIIKAIQNAPEGFQISITEPKRSLEANARMWAMLGELSDQLEWHGQKLSPENWKDMCTAALKRQQVVPGIDGGFCVLGTSTRRMTKGEMAELIDFISAFGAQHNVRFVEPE